MYVSVSVPGSYEPLDEQQSVAILARAEREYCLFVTEDYGWREWIWFPGLQEEEFAHWWVSTATTDLRGDFFQWAGGLFPLGERLLGNASNMTLHIDGTFNTYLQLPEQYKATLIPRFAWNTADAVECGVADVAVDELLLKWWESIRLTALVLPSAYLFRVKTMCIELSHGVGNYKMPSEVRALIEQDPDGTVHRHWENLDSLLQIPSFEPGTQFWEVRGVPYWGRYEYQSVLGGRHVSDRYMHDEGRGIHEAEFLFLVSFCPSHILKGLPRYASRDGRLPDQLPPTYSYWLHRDRLVALSREGFVRTWPAAGIIDPDSVRGEGAPITEAEFRRHFAAYASLDSGAP